MKFRMITCILVLLSMFFTSIAVTQKSQAQEFITPETEIREVETQQPNEQDSNDQDSNGQEPDEQELMTMAVLQKLTVWRRRDDNSPVYWARCRYLQHGCEQQIRTFVSYIFEVAERESFDPWLLAGIAWHESRFFPFTESSEGAVGIFQLLRRSRWSSGLPFVHSRWYRRQCRTELGSCQLPIVERAVYWLKRSIEYCGSVQGGLRMYNSGRCDGPRRYVRAVRKAANDIKARAEELQVLMTAEENNQPATTRQQDDV